MYVKDITDSLEQLAPLTYQEDYDNVGLLVGDPSREVQSVLVTLDVTPDVVDEALQKGANLIVAHHPVIFSGLKRITGKTYTERAVIQAIKHDIAIYAAHTNLDRVKGGVNSKIADILGLRAHEFLQPPTDELVKLVTFVPSPQAHAVRQAMFDAGAGHIGGYDCCSYNVEGLGSFRAGEGTSPHVGSIGKLHFEPEVRIEVILPRSILPRVVKALTNAHPYEEVAYDIYPLLNGYQQMGMGVVGTLDTPLPELEFLTLLKKTFSAGVVRYSPPTGRPVKRVAVCGGSGASLLKQAINANADAFVTADFKYHQFFDAEGRILIADIGHYESEQFTIEIFLIIYRKNSLNLQFSNRRRKPIQLTIYKRYGSKREQAR